jgi:hypothetical protein
MPFRANYDIAMNGGNPGASQWFKLVIMVNEDGAILIHNTLDNDVMRGWSGSYAFELHDIRDNSLLFRIDSPVYRMGPKPPGQHVMQQAADINQAIAPDIAQRFITYPSMYGYSLFYEPGDWVFTGSGAVVDQVGQAVVTAIAAG